ncbi:CoB--CoM heterodisulfide reductase iron-sulfur subunit A family protein [Desulfotomaculum copahuensis]|uniref:Disulfide reductase n=1 Tax=Desulfotomaculum copahuensis TaxID=1838280 RepID=A0A1B7LG74_9FIRM|nr:CoB--CoM heterodisulfide reductase iron-sulfur subunit A family protein [Desulfotomaculum copahuensis]OAT84836.1 disulfide reductase [Desulfotomaculum copahuensis]
MRIGVFICWCGSNIGGVVDVPRVVEAVSALPGVACCSDYKYMCSEPGQEKIRRAIAEHRLDRVVVASCSPRLHENTFRQVLAASGLNPYLLEMANIREHCAWVHQQEPAKATAKAIDLVRRAVAKAGKLEPLHSAAIPVTRRALVVGGGVAGMQAALDIAEAGYQVVLVEKEPSIGGKMAMLDKTFPTLDCAACIITPRMAAVARHPAIKLLTHAEVTAINGYVGNFKITVRQKARSVDYDKCTGCGICQEKCPCTVNSEYDQGLGTRKAIYVSFPQAVPNKPVIDRAHCRRFTRGKCGVCQQVCPSGAVDYAQEDVLFEEEVGAVVLATGYDLFDWTRAYGEYGYGRYPNVITGLQFERMNNANGPTGGKIRRPSDGGVPENVVFIQCVGSRDEAKGKEYCSRVCCLYTAKQARQVLEKIPGAKVHVFYIDVRCAGKAYEEFYQDAVARGACYIRGRVSKIYPTGDKLMVRGADTLLGRPVEIEAGLVVLATAMVPGAGGAELARLAGVSTGKDGFFQEIHPKLRPVESSTAGIFLAGSCQGPRDIPDTVAHAGAAAVKVCALFARGEIITEPVVARINERLCTGCLACRLVCPYRAVEPKSIPARGGAPERTVAVVNSGLCQGCGACSATCRSGAIDLAGFSNEQLLAEISALCH